MPRVPRYMTSATSPRLLQSLDSEYPFLWVRLKWYAWDAPRANQRQNLMRGLLDFATLPSEYSSPTWHDQQEKKIHPRYSNHEISDFIETGTHWEFWRTQGVAWIHTSKANRVVQHSCHWWPQHVFGYQPTADLMYHWKAPKTRLSTFRHLKDCRLASPVYILAGIWWKQCSINAFRKGAHERAAALLSMEGHNAKNDLKATSRLQTYSSQAIAIQVGTIDMHSPCPGTSQAPNWHCPLTLGFHNEQDLVQHKIHHLRIAQNKSYSWPQR